MAIATILKKERRSALLEQVRGGCVGGVRVLRGRRRGFFCSSGDVRQRDASLRPEDFYMHLKLSDAFGYNGFCNGPACHVMFAKLTCVCASFSLFCVWRTLLLTVGTKKQFINLYGLCIVLVYMDFTRVSINRLSTCLLRFSHNNV